MYAPLNVKIGSNSSQNTSLAAPGGMNLRTIPQLLGVENALQITNYFIKGDGNLEKREGISLLTDQGGGTAVSMIKEFLPDIIIFGYGTTVAAYEISTGTVTNLKTDFTSGTFDGARYGDYFFVVNGLDSMERFYRQITATISYDASSTNTLTYGSQTGNFTTGQVLTGGTSGATATISADVDSGTAGTLTLSPVNGTAFQLAEIITDPLGGSATSSLLNSMIVDSKITGATSGATAIIQEVSNAGSTAQIYVVGSVTGTFQNAEVITSDQDSGTGRALTTAIIAWANTAVTAAPIANVATAIGNRLYLGNIKGDESSVAYPAADDGTNAPFTNWTEGTGIDDPGRVRYRSAGTVRSITNLGPYISVYSDKGRFTFVVTGLDSNGTLVKKDDFIDSRIDMGGDRGAITTERGVISVSEAGITQLVSIGQQDVPYSEQRAEVSNLLGDDYFNDFDFTDADIMYDQKRRYLYVTCRRDSAINNLVLAYSFDNQAISEFRGLNIARFLNIDNTIYASSAITGKIYTFLDGYSDEGTSIGTELYQELKLGELYTRQSLDKFYIQGRLSNSTSLQIDFDVYDKDGQFDQARKSYTWTSQLLGPSGSGYDADGYEASYGGDPEDDGLINSFDGAAPGIKNYQRILVRISGGDALPHKINWLNIQGKIKAPIRRRKLSLNS